MMKDCMSDKLLPCEHTVSLGLSVNNEHSFLLYRSEDRRQSC